MSRWKEFRMGLERVDENLHRLSYTLDEWRSQKLAVFPGRECVDRISVGFTIRMAQVYHAYGEYECILRELDYLEGLSDISQTKPEKQFKNPPLHPFWHKHFWTAYHIVPNTFARWGLPLGESDPHASSKQGNAHWDAMMADLVKTHGHDPDRWPAVLAHNFVVDGYEARASKQRLTGSWIVFAKYKGENYYLDVATHSEDDEQLYQKLRNSAGAEFPFLFDSTREAA